MSYLIP